MTDTLFAIAVRDGAGLYLAAQVNRARNDSRNDIVDIYCNIPGTDFETGATDERHAHISHHASGWRHLKTFSGTMGRQLQQQPDAGFVGAEELYEHTFQPGKPGQLGELLALPLHEGDASRFKDIFEIPVSKLSSDDRYSIVVHLLGNGATPPELKRFSKRVAERLFDDDLPAIHVALWAW